MAVQTIRTEMHELIDGMSEQELLDARRYVEFLRSGYTDMLSWVLDTAPIDDEPTTPEEDEGAAEAREQFRRGEGIPLAEIKRRYLS